MGEEEHEKTKVIKIFEAQAKIGEIIQGLQNIILRPEDLSSPVSFQMAISRIMDALMKSVEEGPKKRYVAEIRFADSLGNPVVIAVDLGETLPPFSKREVKARILIELFEDQD